MNNPSAILSKRSYLILPAIIFFLQTLFPQVNQPAGSNVLDHIFSETGLSQNTVHDIIQDKEGYIWFATEDGLNKYDGSTFTIYKNNVQDSFSISDNFILTIYKDHSGTLWVRTNSGGICKYDYEMERFIIYENDPGNPGSLALNNVRAIFQDSKGNIWVGTENGLDKFDR